MFALMRSADQIALRRMPIVVQDAEDGHLTRLFGAADFSLAVIACPTRYSLSDDLVTLCTALAYSKGARTLDCGRAAGPTPSAPNYSPELTFRPAHFVSVAVPFIFRGSMHESR
jgi:hypothetical protein